MKRPRDPQLVTSSTRHLILTLFLAAATTAVSLGSLAYGRHQARAIGHALTSLDLARIWCLPVLLVINTLLSVWIAVEIFRGSQVGYVRFSPIFFAVLSIPFAMVFSRMIAWLA